MTLGAGLKLRETGRDVYVAAQERLDILYRRFDRVVVAFSGGKDSTACLHLAEEAAIRYNRLPVEAVFYDEESIYPTTVEYVERVRQHPHFKVYWYCIPMEHRNACSRSHPYYHTWDPNLRHLWCREPPKGALFDLPIRNDMKWKPHYESMCFAVKPDSPKQTIAMILGIRAQESTRRRTMIANRETENWLMSTRRPGSQVWNAYPIYDWMVQDVWFYPQLHGFDYNRTYDLFDLAGVPINQQRCSPPFGEESCGGLYLYQTLAPEMWAKMVKRVPGVATTARYSRTELFSFGKTPPPAGLTYREWTMQLLNLWPAKYRAQIAHSINKLMNRHAERTSDPIPDVDAHPVTGMSWRYIAMMANRGDMKGRKAQHMQTGEFVRLRARGEDPLEVISKAKAAKLEKRY